MTVSPVSLPTVLEVRTDHAGIRRALAYMHEHYRKDLSLLEIADHVQLSPAYLSHLFRKESGMHLMSYLAVVRMERAKKLLKTTNHSVREISRMVGYHECSYFTSVFRRHHQCTPSQFRSRLYS